MHSERQMPSSVEQKDVRGLQTAQSSQSGTSREPGVDQKQQGVPQVA